MTDQAQSEILENHPIGKGLDAFRTAFNAKCESNGTLWTCLAKKVGLDWRWFAYILV